MGLGDSSVSKAFAWQAQRPDLDPHEKMLGMMNTEGSPNLPFIYVSISSMTKQSNGKIFFLKR